MVMNAKSKAQLNIVQDLCTSMEGDGFYCTQTGHEAEKNCMLNGVQKLTDMYFTARTPPIAMVT